MKEPNLEELSLEELDEVTGGRRNDILAMMDEIDAKIVEWIKITQQAPEGTTPVDLVSFCQPVFDKYL